MIAKTHRQSSFALLVALQGSIVPAIALKIILAALLGVVAVLIDQGYFGDDVKTSADNLNFAPFTALGVAVSLFLGFHNNASYNRWWEARTLLGGQIIAVRNLQRFLLGALDNNDDDDDDDDKSLEEPADEENNVRDDGDTYKWRTHIVRLAMAHTHALRYQLRPVCKADGSQTASDDRDRFLTHSEKELILQSRNPANAILLHCSKIVGRVYRKQQLIDSYTMVQLTRHIDKLCEIQTGCERIHITSLPFAYSLLVHRTAFLYVLLAPFASASSMLWWTPVFNSILAYTFFGLDELARQIQEPFRDEPQCLALSAMCRTIEIDTFEALGNKPVPEFLTPQNSVLM